MPLDTKNPPRTNTMSKVNDPNVCEAIMFRPNEGMNLKSANDIRCITKRRKYCLKNLQQSRQSPRLLIEYFSVLTTKTFNNLDVPDLIFFFIELIWQRKMLHFVSILLSIHTLIKQRPSIYTI